MRFTQTRLWIFAISPFVVALACDRAGEQLTAPQDSPGPGSIQKVTLTTSLHVTNVEELYAAVNDADNAGTVILLSPGTYVLSVANGAGQARPNGGRLEFQRDMSLYGVTGDRGAVVIDASALPASAFSVSFGRTAPIRIGRGSNTIEWLTVVGNPQAAAGIAAELTGTPTTRIRVAHVLAGGSSRGIDIRNVGATMIGRRIEAEVIDNELVGPSVVVGLTEGIRIANFVGADSGVIVAALAGNRAYGFYFGCIFANNRSSNASIDVRSSGDRFFGNTLGCLIAGGLSQATTGSANSNFITFNAHGSQFVDNTVHVEGIEAGGVRVVGGFSTVRANATSDNTVNVGLWGSKISGNLPVDFEAFGGWKQSAPGIAGTNNRVTIALHGVSKKVDVAVTVSTPEDLAGTNSVTVVR